MNTGTRAALPPCFVADGTQQHGVRQRGAAPVRVGLTGMIGAGKSSVGNYVAGIQGHEVFDSDKEVARLYAEDRALIQAIEDRFPGVSDPTTGINRAALAQSLSKDKEGWAALEALVHPRVRASADDFFLGATEREAVAVWFDIPLLFETHQQEQGRFDLVVVVSASVRCRHARVLSRPGMSLERLHLLEARQMPDEQKKARADIVIQNDHWPDTVRQIDEVLHRVTALRNSGKSTTL